jgi:hypothetical protein
MARRSLKEFRESKPTAASSDVTPSGRKSLSEYRESLKPVVPHKYFITPYAKTVKALKEPVKEVTTKQTPKTAITKVKEQAEQLKKMGMASTRSAMAAQAAEKSTEPTYRERVMERVGEAKWPELLKPVGTAIAAIEEIPFSRAVKQKTTMYPELEDPKDRVGGLAGLMADIAIPLTVPGAKLGGGDLYQRTGQVLDRFAPKLSQTLVPAAEKTLGKRVASEAIKGGVTGGVLAPATTLALDPEASGRELAESAAFGSGGGALLGGAVPLVQKGITRLADMRKPSVSEPVSEITTQGLVERTRARPTTRSPRDSAAPSRQSLQQFREGAQPSLEVSQAPVRKSLQEFREVPPIKREEIPFNLDDDEWTSLQGIIGEKDIVEKMASPGLRQRLTTTADDMIATAKQEWAAKGQYLGSNIGPEITILSKLAAGYMLKGTVKLADVTEALVREFGESVRPYAKQIWEAAKPVYKDMKIKTEAQDMGMGEFSPIALKDRAILLLNATDIYRNFERVFGKHAPEVKKSILDPFDIAKDRAVTMQKDQLEELATIMSNLGIKKGSKESALVQQYGEKRITLEQLKAASPKWEQIVKADSYFRSKYDALIDQVNNTVRQIYPNSPDKIVPKRADYYRHFREQGDIAALKALYQTSAGIDPRLSGLSPFTQPKTKWASFKQKRGLGEFKDDAVGGFIDYIPAAATSIHLDPQISVFRNLARNLAEQTKDTGNINNFIRYLNNFANDLAGKTSPLDRWIEDFGGRNTLRVLQLFNNRVKKNVILGNVGSLLAQTANIPSGIAFAKQHAIPAVATTMKSFVRPNAEMSKSKFLKERYLGKTFRQFDVKLLEQPDRFASWSMELADRVGTSFVWNAAYKKGVAEGVPNPIKFADENTRRLVAGRGAGEVPLLHRSKMGQIFLPFQIEVGNLWHVMSDQVRAKDFGGIAILFGANFLLNRVMEQTRGTPVTFDPIDAIYDALKEEDISPFERVGRVSGEVLSSVPGGGLIGAGYSQFGPKIPGLDTPTREELFGERDPTRFGMSPLIVRGPNDPIFNLMLPFGGGQLKKIIAGSKALYEDGAFTDKGELKYPVEKDIGNIIRALLFGPTATAEGKRYYKEEQRPLSELQTREFKGAPNQQVFFEILQKNRKEATERMKRERERKSK